MLYVSSVNVQAECTHCKLHTPFHLVKHFFYIYQNGLSWHFSKNTISSMTEDTGKPVFAVQPARHHRLWCLSNLVSIRSWTSRTIQVTIRVGSPLADTGRACHRNDMCPFREHHLLNSFPEEKQNIRHTTNISPYVI